MTHLNCRLCSSNLLKCNEWEPIVSMPANILVSSHLFLPFPLILWCVCVARGLRSLRTRERNPTLLPRTQEIEIFFIEENQFIFPFSARKMCHTKQLGKRAARKIRTVFLSATVSSHRTNTPAFSSPFSFINRTLGQGGYNDTYLKKLHKID